MELAGQNGVMCVWPFSPAGEVQAFAAVHCSSQSTFNQWYFSAASESSSQLARQQMGLLTWWAEEPQIPAVTVCFVPTDCYVSDHAHGGQKIYSKWLVLMNVSYS